MTASLVAIGILVALTVQGWALLMAHSQQRRLATRLDALTRRLTAAAAEAATRDRTRLLDALAGRVASAFDLAELGGGRRSLAALLAPAKPLLLVVTDPRCGPCYELLPDVGGWQRVYGDRLTFALISAGPAPANEAMTDEYGIDHVLLQHDAEFVEAYGLLQAPAAVLIDPDGRIGAGPRYGVNAIRRLVADTLGLVVPSPPTRAVQAATIGHPAPSFRRPDLSGQVVDLAASWEEPTMLLFWSPGCRHCQELLPELRAFERLAGRPRLTIVSRGPVALNQAAGFVSPVLLDDDRTIARAFGVGGTPAAVMIDGRGIVASAVARGVGAVRALMTPELVPSLAAD